MYINSYLLLEQFPVDIKANSIATIIIKIQNEEL